MLRTQGNFEMLTIIELPVVDQKNRTHQGFLPVVDQENWTHQNFFLDIPRIRALITLSDKIYYK